MVRSVPYILWRSHANGTGVDERESFVHLSLNCSGESSASPSQLDGRVQCSMKY